MLFLAFICMYLKKGYMLMEAVLSFAVFMIVITIITVIVTQISYMRGKITRTTVRYGQFFMVFVCILAILFILIATYFHTSFLFILLGFLVLGLVIIAIVYLVLRARQ